MNDHQPSTAPATPLDEVVAASNAVAATTKRTAKRDRLAELLGRLARPEIEPAVGFLVGEVRQGRIGVGWAAVRDTDVTPAESPTLTVGDVDAAVDALAATTGAGSVARRRRLLDELFGRATAEEADFLRRLFVGELRQGALAGVVTDAVAVAAGVKLAPVRRAAMLSGDLLVTARIALTEGVDGLAAVGLEPLRPVEPMLASTAESVAAAVAELGRSSVEWKLDGARIQVHRHGDEVRIFTRNLNDVTDRLPEVVDVARSLPVASVVLDGEVLGFLGFEDPDASAAFQDTMSRFGRDDATTSPTVLRPWFFDVLHLDGVDLIDEPLVDRRDRLEGLVGEHAIPGTVTDDPEEAAAVLAEAVGRGHEGVMVKGATSTYEAGRRGKAWRKVKPVHTLDLVVIGVEPGSGRRRDWLSNIHLAARDGEALVMVGRTFKGMTDELLAWQTAELSARELPTPAEGVIADVDSNRRVVWVRPELVVEIAVDGAQASTRYAGGVALRFARVKGYRSDKDPADADTLDAVRALLPAGRRDEA